MEFFIKQVIYGPKLDQLNIEVQSNNVPATQPDVGFCLLLGSGSNSSK